MAYRARVLVVAFFTASGLGAGCIPNLPDTGDAGIKGPDLAKPGVGASCSADGDCRDGLKCKADSKTCQPGADRIQGAACVLSAECMAGNFCKPDFDPKFAPYFQSCQPAGTGPEGGGCSTEGDCMSGLTCLRTAESGLYGTCAKPGNSDLGGNCTTSADCRGGLLCSPEMKCVTLALIKPWEGVQGCPAQLPAGEGKVHFQIPRPGEAPTQDFFRLPFPNDIRRSGGHLDLAGLPSPGARFLPKDVVKSYFDAIAADVPAFGLNPVVYFRFSRNPDLQPSAKAVTWFDITAGAPEYGYQRGRSWSTTDGGPTNGGNRYVCDRSLTVWANWSPLLPGHTYAVVLTTEIKDRDGMVMKRDADFNVMMDSAMPTDPTLAAAWQAYAPLRKWSNDEMLLDLSDMSMEGGARRVLPANIVAAAVFTTDKFPDYLSNLRKAVRAAAAPAVKGIVKCAAGVQSPCNDGKGCEGLDPAAPFDEYQGIMTIPAFQQGTPPFETEGGAIMWGADGLPAVARMEDVCFSLTVPKGAAPADGWPVMVYAHGTGGSFRSISVDTGFSKDVATGTLEMGAAPAAAFGYDGPLHGSRRGGSMKKPDELVFNYLNPRAARDTPLQGAADLFAIARIMEGGTVGEVKLNPARVALYGHSQGGNAAAITSGFEPVYKAVVLSGTGGGLVLGILNKKQPVAVSGVLPFVLNDLKVSDTHPVMSLMQLYFDRADPLNYGRYIFNSPPDMVPPHHVLHILGSNDNYAPEGTQLRFALHAGLTTVHPVLSGDAAKLYTPEMMAPPVKLNRMVGDAMVTAVSAQYAPAADYDGHFVSTRNPDARASLLYMLATFFRDGTPIVK